MHTHKYHDDKRLLLYVVAALCVHLILIWAVRLQPKQMLMVSRALEVYLTKNEAIVTPKIPNAVTEIIPQTQAVGRKGTIKPTLPVTGYGRETMTSSAEAGHSELMRPLPSESQQPAIPVAEIQKKSASVSIQTLLDSAHQIATETGKRTPNQKSDDVPLSERPVLAKLAAALQEKPKLKAGVIQYADGVIKIISDNGSSYCMQTESHLLKSGPVDPEGIPMTCP